MVCTGSERYSKRAGCEQSLLMDRLTETKGARIFKRGLKKAREMLEKYEENGVFKWAPSWKELLKDPDYIFYLGVTSSR